MSSNEKERSISKDLDYKSHYADGVILQYTKGNARLVFYQEELNPAEEGKSFDTDTDNIKLIFEVRIPNLGLSTIASHIQQRNNFRDIGLNISEAAKNDNQITEVWHQYNEKLSEFLLDSQKIFPIDKYSELYPIFEDLLLRVNRIINRNNSNPNQSSQQNNHQGQ